MDNAPAGPGGFDQLEVTAALTLMAKERGGVPLVQQVLFYPVTDAAFDTGSYHQFAEGYFLRRDAMQWFWDQYTTDPAQRRYHRFPLRVHPGTRWSCVRRARAGSI